MGLLDSLPLVNPDDRKRNMLADLLRGATGLLDEARPKVQDSWRNGLLSILNPEANQQRASDYLNRQNVTVGGKPYDYNQAMSDMAITGIAPLGMLAYHGSPHTFDKFSLDKIGTGEGAQAYGQGLYLAENPEVAMGYRNKLNDPPISRVKADLYEIAGDPKWKVSAYDADGSLIPKVKGYLDPSDIEKHYGKEVSDMILNTKYGGDFRGLNIQSGAFYKTDIPDEAVARFLDWDKPLSEQAQSVQDLIKQDRSGLFEKGRYPDTLILGSYLANKGIHADALSAQGHVPTMLNGVPAKKMTGQDFWHLMMRGNDGNGAASSDALNKLGIPGIRYLDGGSRGAGTGTSNFVVFDPDMIRILERNGQSTGAQPWQPGEYQNKLAGLLDNSAMNAAPQFKISDVFGDGSRLDHYDYAKGLMYSQQKMPNGKSKWSVFETYPVSEGGNQVLGQMLQHGSLDDAIKSVRGARISQTLKTNNAAKYGGIPNTWDGEAKKVAKKLIDSGVDIDRFGQSTQSTSKYIYLANGRKIRMANHDLPSNYDAADFDHRYGGDIQSLINGIKQSP